MQVNLKSGNRKKIEEALHTEEIPVTIFEEAKEEIYLLMAADNFARFKQSSLFKALLQEVQAYANTSVNVEQIHVATRRFSEKTQ